MRRPSTLARAASAALALAASPARADIECEYMSFQMSDVDTDHAVSLCECGRFLDDGTTIQLIAQRLQCTSEGWQATADLCLDETVADPDPVKRRGRATDALRAYNESFPYCR